MNLKNNVNLEVKYICLNAGFGILIKYLKICYTYITSFHIEKKKLS